MNFNELYRSVFAILRIQNNQAKIVGTGFVINMNPIYILTCNHVVGDASELNNGQIIYAITKRSDNFAEFDLRNITISYLRARRVIKSPQFDLAILEIDPNENQQVYTSLDIPHSIPLNLSFDPNDRIIGGSVEWLTTASSSDMTLTPRFFKGNLVTKYIADHGYSFINATGQTVQQVINGASIIEVDKLFIPGSSGGPILNSESNRVIGYVHGFKYWPITQISITQDVELTENGAARTVSIKDNQVITASLSLGIDIVTIQNYLIDGGFISN